MSSWYLGRSPLGLRTFFVPCCFCFFSDTSETITALALVTSKHSSSKIFALSSFTYHLHFKNTFLYTSFFVDTCSVATTKELHLLYFRIGSPTGKMFPAFFSLLKCIVSVHIFYKVTPTDHFRLISSPDNVRLNMLFL